MKNLLFSLSFLLACSLSYAQTEFTIAPENAVTVSVKGNSTLHEWEAVASEIMDYPAELSIDLDGPTGLENFGFKVGVESLDGGRGASMNKKIRKALIATDHPHIIFNATYVEVVPSDSEDHNQIKTKGPLQIAGKSLDVDVDAKISFKENELVISGSKALKMSDFDIEPPTAMFGQIKTRDDITVHFEFRYIAK